METLSSMWTGHRARERRGVKITLSCSQWLHSFLQKQTYLECGHSLTLCSPCASCVCCLHQSQLWASKWHPKAPLWLDAGFGILTMPKRRFYGSWIYLDIWVAFPFVPLIFQNHEANSDWGFANPILSSAARHRAGCSKGAHCCVHRSCTCTNPSIFVFLYSIDLSINSLWRNPAHQHPCWTDSPAHWLLFPGISQLGVLGWHGAIPLYQFFPHDYYELQLRTPINVHVTEEFGRADENKVLF